MEGKRRERGRGSRAAGNRWEQLKVSVGIRRVVQTGAMSISASPVDRPRKEEKVQYFYTVCREIRRSRSWRPTFLAEGVFGRQCTYCVHP